MNVQPEMETVPKSAPTLLVATHVPVSMATAWLLMAEFVLVGECLCIKLFDKPS